MCFYRQPGQQFTHEESEDIVERARSRNQSRAQDRQQNYEVDDGLQPKIGHHYSRSPSPILREAPIRRPMTSRSASRNATTQADNDYLDSTTTSRRPMTSRSASRNAMTQVDEDYLTRKYHDRSSPPPRGYIEISGKESRAASRAEMRQSMTVPNLNEYTEQPRKQPAYSRHYEYDYNGHRIIKPTSDQEQPLRGNLKPATSLSLLPLSRDANNLNFRDKYNRPGSDWNLTTTKRAFR